MKLIAPFLAGLLFGAGLVISELANPARVLGFLDIAGLWDPTLAFVMAGAVAVTAIGYRVAWKRGAPLFEPSFHLSTRSAIDMPLVLGAALFGIGWGLAGLCPGPAIVALSQGSAGVVLFVLAMIAGLWTSRLVAPRR